MEPNHEREFEQGYRSDPCRSQGAVAPHLAGFQRGSGVRSLCSAGCRVVGRPENCRVHPRKLPSVKSPHQRAPGMVPPLRCGLDFGCAPARRRRQGASATGRRSAQRRFHSCSEEWPWPHRLPAEEMLCQPAVNPPGTKGQRWNLRVQWSGVATSDCRRIKSFNRVFALTLTPGLAFEAAFGAAMRRGGHLWRWPPGEYIGGAYVRNFDQLSSQSIHSTELIHLRMHI